MNLQSFGKRGRLAVRLLSAAVSFSLLPLPIKALADIDMKTVKYESEKLSISGTVSKPYAAVTAFVVPAGVSLSDTDVDAANENKYALIASAADKDGNYSVTIGLPLWYSSGPYKVFVSDGTDTKEASFTHLSYSAAQIALDGDSENRGINSAVSESDMEALLTGGLAVKLGIENVTEDIVKGLYVGKTEKKYTVDYFLEDLARIKVISALKNAADYETADSVIKEGAEKFGMDYDSDYYPYTEAVKKGFADIIKQTPIGGSSVYKMFYRCMLLSVAQNQSSAANMCESAEKYGETADLDFTYYNRLSEYNKTKAAGDVMNSIPKDFEELADAFYKCSKKVYDSLSNGSSGGGSSSGSSGGSSFKPPKDNGQSGSTDISIDGDINNIPDGGNDEDAKAFSDLRGHWAESAVNSLVAKNIISGFEDGTFRPEEGITRAQFSKLICLAFGLNNSTPCAFSDVSASDWYANYVYAAYNAGLINGYDGRFSPDEKISRQDCAVIVYRMLKDKLSENGSTHFADSALVSDYAAKAVQVLADNGIMTGYGDMFNPTDGLTRAQGAKLICNILDSEVR